MVLPLPEPPITAAKMPCGMLKLMLFRIGRSPYAKATSFISMKGVELMQERGVKKCILITGIVKGIGYSGNFQTACA